jgi:hypothetical protein
MVQAHHVVDSEMANDGGSKWKKVLVELIVVDWLWAATDVLLLSGRILESFPSYLVQAYSFYAVSQSVVKSWEVRDNSKIIV